MDLASIPPSALSDSASSGTSLGYRSGRANSTAGTKVRTKVLSSYVNDCWNSVAGLCQTGTGSPGLHSFHILILLETLLFSRKFRDCGSVFARVGSAVIDSSGEIAHHRLPSSHERREGAAQVNLVPFVLQFLADIARETVFHGDVASCKRMLAEPRVFERRLDVHFEVYDIGDKLRVGLRLIPPTHNAEGDAHIPLLHHGRDDGVEWPLAGLQCIRGCRIEGEEGTAILQGKTRSRSDQSRPEILKVALDERHHVSFAVHDAQIDGVAAGKIRLARGNVTIGLVHVDFCGAPLCLGCCEQALDRCL